MKDNTVVKENKKDSKKGSQKGNQRAILRRLFGFLKPYKIFVFLAVLGLMISTAADLLMPVLIQRTVDQYILGRHVAVERRALDDPEMSEFEPGGGAVHFEDLVLLRESEFEQNSAELRRRLHDAGYVGQEHWSLWEVNDSTRGATEALDDSLIVNNGFYAAVAISTFKGFDQETQDLFKTEHRRGVVRNTLIFAGLLILLLVSTFMQVYLMAGVGQRVMKDLRIKLLNHTARQSLNFFNKNPLGSLVTRVTNDVETINELFTSVAVSIIKDISLMIGVIVTLFFLNARLALITAATLPPVLIFMMIFRVWARDAYRRVRKWVSSVNAFLSEHITGIQIVQLMAREKRSRKDFKKDSDSLLKANLSEMYVFAVFRPLVRLLGSISVGFIIYFGAYFYLDKMISLGVLIAFINLIDKFYQPVQDMSEKFTIMQSAMAGGERVFQLLDDDQSIPDKGSRSLGDDVKGEIAFENVCFEYVTGEPVLNDLSFTVKPGETVAIVGSTGAGKSTIINLLTRLWDIQGGSIKLDGTDIKDLVLNDLRRAVQPVQQDVFLFSGSVKENILLGSALPDDVMINAAKTVRAHDFISAMEQGYETALNEGATNISAGQRQLLSFARVLAQNPQVVILDEATANIDTETEKLIQEALDHLLADRTALVIAHRLSTIQNADRILVLGNGRLLEQGSHGDLIAKKGVYYNLYKLQYQEA